MLHVVCHVVYAIWLFYTVHVACLHPRSCDLRRVVLLACCALEYRDLPKNKLKGRLTPRLMELRRCTHLNLRQNRLAGPMPLELRQFKLLCVPHTVLGAVGAGCCGGSACARAALSTLLVKVAHCGRA